MASFDIVSKVDQQNLDNAVNNARKEILTRYDFKGSKTEIELDKKSKNIHVTTEDSMRLKAVGDILISKVNKQGIDPNSLDLGKEEYAAGNMVKKDIKVIEGIDRDTAKKVVKLIKDSKLKVQASIMEEQVRVSGKKIDDLQQVIALLRQEDLGIPLQYINMK